MNEALPQANSHDLDWVAFQYLGGELSAAEVARFEASLQTDQAAREALARSVEMTRVVALIESSTAEVALESSTVEPRRNAAPWMSPAVWLAVAALACVTLLLAWDPGFSERPTSNSAGQPVVEVDGESFDSGELASLWVTTSEILVSTELIEREILLDDEPHELLPEGTAIDVDRLQAPSWMMAALATVEHAEMPE